MGEEKERRCVVLGYRGKDYWDGTATYSSDFNNAKIFKESEVPEWVKTHYDHKIIFLDTEEGLELLVKEFKNNQDYVDIYESRVEDAKATMKKLYKFDSVRKYIEMHNKWYNPLIGISRETENRLIEEIVSEKA